MLQYKVGTLFVLPTMQWPFPNCTNQIFKIDAKSEWIMLVVNQWFLAERRPASARHVIDALLIVYSTTVPTSCELAQVLTIIIVKYVAHASPCLA
jgi:hypothetical protein